ncbi:LuxR C-terminal-related transcriptional regulator [Streptacidiphilus sp. EB103A]|uniref:LuxR C-terminal-related transcriptional regulator n=1 Tax=Streptacidiphilus sp. EB103A TaxID=3156275 RepID=UPI00351948B6
MGGGVELDEARQAYGRRAWSSAFAGFTSADARSGLAPEDLERLAESADMTGRGEEAAAALQRAYTAYEAAGERGRALRCAFWLQSTLGFNGSFARAAGWAERAGRLVGDGADCAERGYLLTAQTRRLFEAGDFAAAASTAAQAVDLERSCGDPDLRVLALHALGRALIRLDRQEEGLALLDEAMVAVIGGELSPRATGIVYCSAIGACSELQDLYRAREWTAALADWYGGQPEFTGAYHGLCRVHRVAVLRVGGAWATAQQEAEAVCREVTDGSGGHQVIGAAYYQLAELHRLRGRLEQAELAYRAALRHGWETQPGLSLLRLAQRRTSAAAVAVRRALAETAEPLARLPLLSAAVEILLAAQDQQAARDASAELAERAELIGTPALLAASAWAHAAVALAGRPNDDSAATALADARRAWRLWRDQDAPYEAARARVLVALACRTLGDEEGAAMELDAAAEVFGRLGAAPDLALVRELLGARRGPGALTARECEVLRLVALGLTNHAIAGELFLSEKTVARHLSNIYPKLGVASRTAAAAYAFEHGLYPGSA